MQRPTSEHMKATINVVRYLKNAPSQGILMANNSAAQLTAFCDSDWANCPTTRRSTFGYCIMRDKSPISWKTKKQLVMARSSAKAEYRSMVMTCCEVLWLLQLFKDLGLKKLNPETLRCGNKQHYT